MSTMRILLAAGLLCIITFISCNQNKSTKTIINLKASIIGETTASAKYAAFAQKADDEGNPRIAKLFDAASKAESIHAGNHTKVLAELGEKMDDFKPEFEVKTTAENLQTAIEGENYEIETMYPQFLADCKLDKIINAEKSFALAFYTEKKHKEFYTKALEALKADTTYTLPSGYAVCPVCGNTYDCANIDDNCTFCQTSKDKFINNKTFLKI